MINVLIVDDHLIFRMGVKEILSCDDEINYVGEARDGEELLELYPQSNADVILMDVNMPKLDGFSTTQIVTSKFKDVKVLLMSFKVNKMDFYKSYQNGAKGIINKDQHPLEFLKAIKVVAGGEYYFQERVDEQFISRLVERYSHYNPASNEISQIQSQLSNREIEILKLIARGLTSKRIAMYLNVTLKTIEYHRRNIRTKLDIHDNSELISYFLENYQNKG